MRDTIPGGLRLRSAIANAEDRLRDFPEDVTDEFKHALKLEG
jgi:hypothetical protein